jgi:hypothetical protein
MSDKLEIAVAGPPAGTPATDATITVQARNASNKPVRVIDCVLLFPMGLRVSADAPGLAYPALLDGGYALTDGFSCATLAHLARQSGYASRVMLIPIVLEGGGFDESFALRLPTGMRSARGVEHRGVAFAFDVRQWS